MDTSLAQLPVEPRSLPKEAMDPSSQLLTYTGTPTQTGNLSVST